MNAPTVRRNASTNFTGPIVGQSNVQPSQRPKERNRQVTWQESTQTIDAHALQPPQSTHLVNLTDADAQTVQPHMETIHIFLSNRLKQNHIPHINHLHTHTQRSQPILTKHICH